MQFSGSDNSDKENQAPNTISPKKPESTCQKCRNSQPVFRVCSLCDCADKYFCKDGDCWEIESNPESSVWICYECQPDYRYRRAKYSERVSTEETPEGCSVEENINKLNESLDKFAKRPDLEEIGIQLMATSLQRMAPPSEKLCFTEEKSTVPEKKMNRSSSTSVKSKGPEMEASLIDRSSEREAPPSQKSSEDLLNYPGNSKESPEVCVTDERVEDTRRAIEMITRKMMESAIDDASFSLGQ